MKDASTLKRSLVLAGGGVRLAYHAGVLLALQEEGLSFNHVDGTSGGIFGTAMLASGIPATEVASRWRNLHLKGFMSMLPLSNYRSQRRLTAIGSAKGVREKIFPALGISLEKINSHTAFEATFNVCNFTTKTVEAISHRLVTEDHLIAGISLPVFMPAVNINGVWYTDAVWIKDANITEAVGRGAEEVWLVWCIGNTPEYRNGFFNQYVHMIEMSANGGLIQELNWVRDQNAARVKQNLAPIRVHLIKPLFPLPLDPDFFLGRINADTLINMGYADTKQYLLKPDELNLEDAVKAITMNSQGITLHFRQQYEGDPKLTTGGHKWIIRLAFFIHEINGAYVWRQFSSVENSEKLVISGYENKTMAAGGKITAQFVCILSGIQYDIKVEMQLNSIPEFMIGLDAKTARVFIGSGPGPSSHHIFYQQGLTRLKNILHMNLKADAGWWQKMKIKKRLLNSVFK